MCPPKLAWAVAKEGLPAEACAACARLARERPGVLLSRGTIAARIWLKYWDRVAFDDGMIDSGKDLSLRVIAYIAVLTQKLSSA